MKYMDVDCRGAACCAPTAGPGIANTFIIRVFPGVAETFASRTPVSALSRVDLPALARPTNATSGSGGSNGVSARGNEPTKYGRSMLRPYSGFFLLARALGHQQGRAARGHAFGIDRDFPHVVAARQLEHDLGHHLFENGAQPACARAALDTLLGDGAQRFLLDREAHVLELEQLLVLLDQGVLRLDEEADQRLFVEGVEGYRDGQ